MIGMGFGPGFLRDGSCGTDRWFHAGRTENGDLISCEYIGAVFAKIQPIGTIFLRNEADRSCWNRIP